MSIRVRGWTFDSAREVWWAHISANTWTEVRGTLDNPPSWAPWDAPPSGAATR